MEECKSVALTENEMATITQLAFDPEFGCTHKKQGLC